MAKLATPRLIDVSPTPLGLRSVPDRLIEVGTKDEGVRLTLRNESGALSASLTLTVVDGKWADCVVAVTADADPSTYSRVNRLLGGYEIRRDGHKTVSTKRTVPPKVGNYWRTKEGSMFHAGRVVSLPVVAEGKPTFGSSGTDVYVSMKWTLKAVPVVLEANASLGYVPVSALAPRAKRAAAKSSAKVVRTTTPTIRESIGLTTPPVTPEGVTPRVTAKPAGPSTVKASPSVLPEGHPGIFRDIRLSKTVHVTPETDKVLTKAYEGFTFGDRTVIILRGPSGSGKTITAMALAAKHRLPFWKVDVAALRDFSDWAGSMTLTPDADGKIVTAYQPSQLVEAISADGPYGGIPRMVLLDEINRCETAGALNAAGPILDGTGTLYVPDARKSIVIDPAVLFVGTANIGAEFTGTGVLDHMIVTRGTCWWDVDYPTEATETTILVEQGGIDATVARQLVQVATQIRAIAARLEIPVGVSTRQLVSAALLVSRGLSAPLACTAAFGNTYSPDGGGASDRAKVTMVIRSTLGA